MKILIAPDKFKGSMSAMDVCDAIGKGLIKSGKQIEILKHPMADGGDGSLDVIKNFESLEERSILTIDPLGREIFASYLTSTDCAFIEMASASGVVLLSHEERNPLKTSTSGTGKMLVDAISRGYKKIYLFLGGSATNDGGMGVCHELGFRFLDGEGHALNPIGENLIYARSIDKTESLDFEGIEITLLCDVTNPLFGHRGAAYTYARQKGANDDQIEVLDKGLRSFNQILKIYSGQDVSELTGIGAAGGIGAGLVALFNSELKSGFEVIAQLTELEERIFQSDVVISGEGRLDAQSLQGKVIGGISKICQKLSKPLVLFVGQNQLGFNVLSNAGVTRVYEVDEKANDFEDAISHGPAYLQEMAYDFGSELL